MKELQKNISRIYQLGAPETEGILYNPVVITEKVDGSQFNFGRIDRNALWFHSHHCPINELSPPGMFKTAVETVKSLETKLNNGWAYHGEVLEKSKHNILRYAGVPKGNIILWGMETDLGNWLPYELMEEEAERLGLPVVPRLYAGWVKSTEHLDKLLDTTSVLGGTKIEGIIIRSMLNGQFAKYVSPAFRETRKESKTGKLTEGVNQIVSMFRTDARYAKAYIHLKEQNKIQDNMKDMALLVQEVGDDLVAEQKPAIMEALWNHFWPNIRKGVVGGLAEWYKIQLAKSIIPLSVQVDPEPVDETGVPAGA